MSYRFRNNDGKQVLLSQALRNINGTMKLNADDVGPSGSTLRKEHTTGADDGIGCLPHISWSHPGLPNIQSYALVCEDLDAAYPDHMHHGIFYNIPPARTTATTDDVEKQAGENTPRLTSTAWKFVTTHGNNSYLVPRPPAGQGTHRYVFTIIALNQPQLEFDRPEKVTKQQFHKALVGKVITWGQWIGTFGVPCLTSMLCADFVSGLGSLAAPEKKALADGKAVAGDEAVADGADGEASAGQASPSRQTDADGRLTTTATATETTIETTIEGQTTPGGH